jgi:large subunit ribosomal protein L13
VISGKKDVVLDRVKQRVRRGIPSKGPHFKRAPDRLLKRMIRNMLPYKQAKGEAAYKRIKCWRGVPDQFKDKKAETIKAAQVSKLPNLNYVSIARISQEIGGKTKE